MSFLGESLQTWGEEGWRQDLHRSQSLPEIFMHSCGAYRCGIIETLFFLTIAETGHGIRGCFSASTSVTQSEISTRGISVELSVYQV